MGRVDHIRGHHLSSVWLWTYIWPCMWVWFRNKPLTTEKRHIGKRSLPSAVWTVTHLIYIMRTHRARFAKSCRESELNQHQRWLLFNPCDFYLNTICCRCQQGLIHGNELLRNGLSSPKPGLQMVNVKYGTQACVCGPSNQTVIT